jgi:hypothetical protein
MSRVMRTIAVRHAVFGLALTGLAMSSMSNAKAGDLYEPAYRPYPQAAPYYQRVDREGYYGSAPLVHRRVEIGDEICRIFHERRIDPYGRETLHRIRMCDDGPVYSSSSGAVVVPEYGYQPRPNYEQSGYYSYPRPPVAIGQEYYN